MRQKALLSKRPFTWSANLHLGLFAALILLPQVLLGSLVAYQMARDIEDQTLARTHAVAADLATAADDQVDDYISILQSLGTAQALQTGDFAAFYEQAVRQLKVRGTSMVLRDREGNLIFNTRLPWGSPLPRGAAEPRRAAQQVLASGKPQISDLHTGAVSNETHVTVGVPVFVGDVPTYVISMAIPPVGLRRLLQAHSPPEGWVYTIADKENRVIARSRNHEQYFGEKLTASQIENIVPARSLGRATTLDGDVAVAASALSPLTGWKAVVLVPEMVLYEPRNRLVRYLLALGSLAVFISCCGAYLYGRIIVRGLRELHASAGDIGAGEVPKLAQSVVSEISSVSNALQLAGAEIRHREQHKEELLTELDHRVKNNLSVVLSLSRSTLREANIPQATRELLDGRLLTLGRAHEVLSNAGWRPILFSDLAEAIVDREQTEIAGPNLHLSVKATTAIAQILHELVRASNTRAVGDQSGKFSSLRWSILGDKVHITWRDTNPGTALIGDANFRLVRLIAERQLGGSVDISSTELMLQAAIEIPLHHPLLGVNAACAEADPGS